MRFLLLLRPAAQPRLTQSVAWALLCAIALGSVGVPVYRPARKNVSKPFPCQDHACGCSDADACWRSCCCHTQAEKVAWARKHGVTPPPFVLVAAADEARASCGAVGCCSARGKTRESTGAAQDAPRAGRLTVVAMSDYLKCRGLSSLWVVLSQGLPGAPERPTWSLQPSGEWIAGFSQSALSTGVAPDLPPPKAAA